MPACLVKNMAPLTDTVRFIFACLTLSINPSIPTGEPSLYSPGAHTNKEWKSYAPNKRSKRILPFQYYSIYAECFKELWTKVASWNVVKE